MKYGPEPQGRGGGWKSSIEGVVVKSTGQDASPRESENRKEGAGAEPTDLQEGKVKWRDFVQKQRGLGTVRESQGTGVWSAEDRVRSASPAAGTWKVSSILAIFYPLAIM